MPFTPLFGIDYAYGNPGPARLKKAGVKFVCRYLSTPGNSKNLNAAEAKALRAAGLAVVTVFETTAARALSGRIAGAADAASAQAQLKSCGAPVNAPVYFAVDFDAAPGQQAALNAYLLGAASVLGHARVGVYGSYYVVKRALGAGVCKYGWQTYAWSGGQWEKRAQLQQYSNGHKLLGVNCDFNRAVVADFGQWPAKAAPVPPKPPPPPKPKPDPFNWKWLRKYGPKRKPRWLWQTLAEYRRRTGRKP